MTEGDRREEREKEGEKEVGGKTIDNKKTVVYSYSDPDE